MYILQRMATVDNQKTSFRSNKIKDLYKHQNIQFSSRVLSRNYFLTSTILESKIWESPHISQPHGISHHGQNKIQFVGPVPPGFILISSRIIIIILLEEQSTKCLALSAVGCYDRYSIINDHDNYQIMGQ